MFFILLLGLSFAACKKNTLKEKGEETYNKNEISAKVNAWLDKQAKSARHIDSVKIISLKNQLNFEKLRVEDLKVSEKFIIVPIKDAFIVTANKTKPVTNYLLLILDYKNEIRKGHILQYMSEKKTQKSELPEMALYNLYNFKSVSGTFTYVSIMDTDHFYYEIEHQNGKLYRTGIPKPAGTSGRNNLTNPDGCTDWYLVTTYYYTDGSCETTSEFLYTACPNVEGGEGGSGGGQSGGNPQTEPPQPASNQETWFPAKAANGSWLILSTESFTGTRYPNSTTPSIFTGITHSGDAISASSTLGATWVRTGATAWLYSSGRADVKISGVINFSQGDPINVIDKANVWLAMIMWP